MIVTREQFKQMTGDYPERDDMARVNCSSAGTPGHWQCGVCADCNKPRFVCGHLHPALPR